MKWALAATRLKLYLPLPLERYCEEFRKRVQRGIADAQETEQMIALLEKLHREAPESLSDDSELEALTPQAFHRRNDKILQATNQVLAFRRGPSTGTDATIAQAKRRGLRVEVRDYDHID